MFSLLHKKIPKLFRRLGVICLLGVMSLLITDVVGHSVNGANVANRPQCMFQVIYTNNGKLLSYPTLNMHWAVIIPPTLLLGIGPLMVITKTFEFISAQSPQSMKGLLVAWSLLCHQRSLSIPQFHCHHSLVLQVAMGQWQNDRAHSSH